MFLGCATFGDSAIACGLSARLPCTNAFVGVAHVPVVLPHGVNGHFFGVLFAERPRSSHRTVTNPSPARHLHANVQPGALPRVMLPVR
jgi:hypothetical protein